MSDGPRKKAQEREVMRRARNARAMTDATRASTDTVPSSGV